MARRYLVLEAATSECSVAIISDDETMVAHGAFHARDAASGALTEGMAPAAARVLIDGGLSARDLAGVVCDAGPGGFTSLRVAAAIAKGICSASGAPLYGVSSLEIIAWSAAITNGKHIAAIDAGRGECFVREFERDGDRVTMLGDARVIRERDLDALASTSGARIAGRGYDTDALPSAASVAGHLAEIISRGEVDLETWEPTYGRLPEAQVKWEAANQRELAT